MREIEDFTIWFLRNGSLNIKEIIRKFTVFGFSEDEAYRGIQIALDNNLVILESGILKVV